MLSEKTARNVTLVSGVLAIIWYAVDFAYKLGILLPFLAEQLGKDPIRNHNLAISLVFAIAVVVNTAHLYFETLFIFIHHVCYGA